VYNFCKKHFIIISYHGRSRVSRERKNYFFELILVLIIFYVIDMDFTRISIEMQKKHNTELILM